MSKRLVQDLDDLRLQLADLKIHIPIEEDLAVLGQSVAIGQRRTPNALAVHPMEGADGERDGSPSELTFRRYRRFAAGGAGLLWTEAVAVVPEGRANPRQLYLHDENVDGFKQLVEEVKRTAREACGHEPLLIAQLTHSGRYSKPSGQPAPMIAYHNEYLDQASKLDQVEYTLASDAYLDGLIEAFRHAAKLARDDGFDGVDIKCCHGYLFAELLSAYHREGKYGGDYQGRTRLLREIVQKVHEDQGADFLVGVRLNLYDGLPQPWGWGATTDGEIDFAEPERLIKDLVQDGAAIFNATAGNPYYQPHINRPYTSGGYEPPEDRLVGIERLLHLSGKMQKAAGEIPVVGVGFSYLRAAAPYVAAAAVRDGSMRMAGFGRLSFANPNFAKDILERGKLEPSTVCTACSGCTNLMRAGQITGCIVRDPYYRDLYRSLVKQGLV